MKDLINNYENQIRDLAVKHEDEIRRLKSEH